ncbi:KAP family P-loop NTPase fold protein [Rhodanobacter ginsengiterrae]|uniref:KAP family P-loop NTPase fold protein n=1 Tax=Rhodanobacter ginsengiterrae TaxID=2008451 RepID=UPI003CF2AAB1
MDADTPSRHTSTRRYLRDEPALEDKFGAHKRIAKGMANAIRANPDLKVVGLIGPWGSGKSTVVGFLEQELRADEGIESHVFTYDAWVHQNDPPRRAFLQELIHFLISKGLTLRSEWQRKLDQLNGQIEDTLVTKTPLFTTGGAAIFFSLLLSPFGASLLMKAGIEDALHGTPGFPWKMVIGAVLLIAPVLASFGVYLAWRPVRKPWDDGYFTKKNLAKHRKPMEGQSILAMFMSKEITSHKNSVTRDPVPTAIEFQKIFRTIMHAVAKKNRRFVFVVDNLDRLPPDEAIEMWSTIRSFFLGAAESLDEKDNTELPTVILPLDEQAVQEIYGESSVGDANSRASAFMEKTFDLTFRITRPVLTDWQSYLRSQMTVLFGTDLKETWVRQTTAFLDAQFLQMPVRPITPRRINTLLNTIGVTWEQWEGAGVPFASVAYYCTFRDLFDKALQTEIVVPHASIGRYDPDWQRSVAALHYGVDPTKAYQVLLEGPLRSAIAANSDKEFSSLTQSPGFHPVFHRIVQKLRDTENLAPDAVMSTINVLARATSESSVDLSEEWQLLQEAFDHTAMWVGLGVVEREAVGHLLERSSDRERHLILASTISHVIGSPAASDPNLADQLGALFNQVDDSYPQIIEGFDELVIPNNPETFVRVAAICIDRPRVLNRLKSGALTDEIGVVLLNGLNTNLPQEMDRRFMAVVQTRHNAFSAAFYEAAAQNLATVNSPGAATTLLAIGFGRKTNDPNAVAAASSLVSTGRLAAIVTESWTPDTPETFTRSSALLILLQPTQYPLLSTPLPLPLLVGDLVEPLESALREFSEPSAVTFGALARVTLTSPSTGLLLSQLLSRRVAHEQVDDFTGRELFARYDELQGVLGFDSFNSLLKLLARTDDFWRSLAARPIDQSSLAALKILHDENPGRAERPGEALAALVEEIPSETWTEAIANPNIAMQAVNQLRQRSSRSIAIPKLAVPLTMAMDQIFEPPSQDWLERWFLLGGFLAPSNRQTLLRTLRDRIINAPPATGLVPILGLGGDALITEGHFDERADEFIRLLVPPFYTQPGAREYLITYAVALAPLVTGAAPETRQTISDWLAEMSTREGQNVHLAEALLASWSPHLKSEDGPSPEQN